MRPYRWLLTTTMVSLAGVVAAAAAAEPPKPTVMRQAQFAIPFRVEPSNDPAWHPIEAQLYVSTDGGTHWQMCAKAATTQSYFIFRTAANGEYWFAVRTADRSGKVRPETIAAPGLRVQVDAKLPPANSKAVPVSLPSQLLKRTCHSAARAAARRTAADGQFSHLRIGVRSGFRRPLGHWSRGTVGNPRRREDLAQLRCH